MASKNIYGIVPSFSPRNINQPKPLPKATFAPVSYSFNEIGGPKQATIKATGDDTAIAELFDLIGCPVELRDRNGEPRWWGMVVGVSAGAEGVSLDDMSNSISIVYNTRDANGVSTNAKTSPTTDADSIAEYGTKELIKTASNATPASAAAMATAALAVKKYPPVKTEINTRADGNATLTCRGMFDVLKWRYYSAPAIGTSSTAPANSTATNETTVLGYGIDPALTENAAFTLGTTTSQKVEFTFTVQSELVQLLRTLRLKGVKAGTPTDDLTVDIYSDNAGALNVLMGSVTIENSLISSSGNAVFDITMDQGTTKIWCAPNVVYHAQVRRNGSLDNTNFYYLHGQSALGNTASATRIWNGSAWVNASTNADIFFLLNTEATEASFDLLGVSTHQRIAVSFTLGGTQDAAVGTASATLARVGNPTGNLTGFVCSDTAGNPGTVIDSFQIACNTISTSGGKITFTFPLNTLNSPSATLWFQIMPDSYTANGADYIRVIIDRSAAYTGGATKAYTGSAWSALLFTGQMLFDVVGTLETTTQIKNIVAAFNQFVNTTAEVESSGVFTSPYRDGNTTAQQIINDLLRNGTSTGAAALLTITRDFVVKVYADLGSNDLDDYYMGRDGRIFTRTRIEIDKSLCPVGWYRRIDSLAAISANSRLLNASLYAVAEAEYNVDSDSLRLTARGARDPFEIGVREG